MPSPTFRLYYDDSYLLAFDATVIDGRSREGHTAVALDRSAFYPTSGGQAHDMGHLLLGETTRAGVVDVDVDDDGVVWHVLDTDGVQPWAAGATVQGEVDAVRRADHRQQHSGQHVLSASFASVCHAETRSVHLGSEWCTLDLDREFSPDALAAVEDAANRVVLDNRAVRVRYVDGAEAATLPLRRPTARSGTIRLVEIDGHDLSACGGTHVAQTGEIGAIVIRGAERFKGGSRVTFVCGMRAVASHRALSRALDTAARALSVGPDEVADAVSRLQEDSRESRRTCDAAQARIAVLEAEALTSRFSRAGGVDVLVADADADGAGLRRMAASLVEVGGRVVVLVGRAAPHALVVARSPDVTRLDAEAFARQVAQAQGGKAGGRPDFAQGGGLDRWDAEDVRARLGELLG